MLLKPAPKILNLKTTPNMKSIFIVKGPIKGPCTYAKPVPKGWISGKGPYIFKYGPGGKLIVKPWPYKPITFNPFTRPMYNPITFGHPMCL